jgi:ADP-heptose:LPS heptosyltransferase
MNAWVELTRREHDDVWDMFYRKFGFSPSTSKFPEILEPESSLTYSRGYDLLISSRDNFRQNALAAFKSIVSPGGRMYALDWQHECYWFYPHLSENERWWIDVPDSEYAIFLSEDFGFGFFGHPWEATICVFGQELLEAFQKYPPRLFENIVRKDGKPV